MPYASNADLPAQVRNALPADAQTVYRRVVTSQLKRGLSEERSHASAWAAVGRGWEKPKDGDKWVKKNSPGPSDVHVPRPLGADEREEALAIIKRMSVPRPLYVRRDVLNGAEIVAWAKEQGFKTTIPADELHVTVLFSKTPVDWMAMGEDWSGNLETGQLTIPAGGPRAVERFGPMGEVGVLAFASSSLAWRNRNMIEAGATSEWPDYNPHISISWDVPADLDFDQIKPYAGKIILGPEIFEPIIDDWKDSLVEKSLCKVAGMDDSLGLVFGWAIVCKVNGEDYYDLNIDVGGQRVPEHIPEQSMLKAASSFMKSSRPGNEMHAGPDAGSYTFAFPLTSEIAKAMGIQCDKTGLMVGYYAPPEVYAKFKDGTYTGFSIEGSRVRAEEVE